MTNNGRQDGFTLIEVLVAFTILAMSLSVIFRIFSSGLRQVALAEDYARAATVAQSQLAVTGISVPLELGATRGSWDTRFRWERVIEPYQPWEKTVAEVTRVQAFRVTVNVTWGETLRPRQVTLRSVRLGPAVPIGGLR